MDFCLKLQDMEDEENPDFEENQDFDGNPDFEENQDFDGNHDDEEYQDFEENLDNKRFKRSVASFQNEKYDDVCEFQIFKRSYLLDMYGAFQEDKMLRRNGKVQSLRTVGDCTWRILRYEIRTFFLSIL